MLTGVLVALTYIVYLAFVGLLLWLCIRTQSKGLIVLFATYVGFMVVGAIFQPFFQQYIDRWVGGEVNNWLTERMTLGTFLMIFVKCQRLFRPQFCKVKPIFLAEIREVSDTLTPNAGV